MNLTFILRTFGCKTNQYETQGIRQSLLQAGLVEAEQPQDAQVLIANTCTVTGKAGDSCRYEIRRCLRANPQLRVIVTGCAVDVGEKWLEQEDYIETVFANPHKARIAPYLMGEAIENEPSDGDRFAFSIDGFHGHTRAFLKIQDGCDNFCSYCIIPYARGVPQSRDSDGILQEAQRLCHSGFHELVLTGINIGAYNSEGLKLPALLRQLCGIEGLWRLRLGSVEPIYVTEELLDVVREYPQICNHIHLPLQSGDDRILKAMNRKYTVAEFLATVKLCREKLDHPGITTDIICGFPGEDDASFAQTMKTVEQARFSRMHIFTYSPREGTPAAEMKQCPSNDVTRRRKELGRLSDQLAAEYAEGLVGRNEHVIVERATSGSGELSGYTGSYMKVIIEHPPAHLAQGQLVDIHITRREGAELYGVVVSS